MTILQMMLASGGGAVPLEYIGADANGADSASFTLTYPAGIASGDLMLIVTSAHQSSRNHPTAPAGWTDKALGTAFDVYTKIAAGGESGTLTMGAGSSEAGAVLYVLRGASDTLIDVDVSWIDEQAAVAPSSTATAIGQLHLIGSCGLDADSVTGAAGYTLAATGAEGSGAGAEGYYKELTASGATGTKSLGGTVIGSAWSIIVGPA